MMRLEQLYPSIFKRKSTRLFKKQPLSKDDLDFLIKEIEEIDSLTVSTFDWMIVYYEQTKLNVNVKAPAYFKMLIKDTNMNLISTGYIMQQLDLICSQKGIATCWLGFNRIKKSKTHPGFYETIRLAVGYAKNDVHRHNQEEFKRLPFNRICNSHRFLKIIEPARLSPSSLNQQPWYFQVENDTVTIIKRPPHPLVDILHRRFFEINCGIALLHLIVAMKYYNVEYELELNVQTKQDSTWLAKIHIHHYLVT